MDVYPAGKGKIFTSHQNFRSLGFFCLMPFQIFLLQGRLRSTTPISLPGIGIFKYHVPHSCALSKSSQWAGSRSHGGAWHLQRLGESVGRLSNFLSPYFPWWCPWFGFLSALFMSRQLREGHGESYLHSITFKSYKLLATINNLPADSPAHKNLGLCICCIHMCVSISALWDFSPSISFTGLWMQCTMEWRFLLLSLIWRVSGWKLWLLPLPWVKFRL